MNNSIPELILRGCTINYSDTYHYGDLLNLDKCSHIDWLGAWVRCNGEIAYVSFLLGQYRIKSIYGGRFLTIRLSNWDGPIVNRWSRYPVSECPYPEWCGVWDDGRGKGVKVTWEASKLWKREYIKTGVCNYGFWGGPGINWRLIEEVVQ